MMLPNRIQSAVQLNPTLAVSGLLSTIVDGDQRGVRLNLQDHPDLAAWLVSILDCVLCQQGKLPGPRPIAEPPAGPTRQKLIDAGILSARTRPDGGLALGLNPQFNALLMLDVRRRGERAHNVLLPLAEDPDLTRWLLMYYVVGPAGRDLSRLSDTLVASLRRHSVLVEEMPAENVNFPDPAVPVDLADELAPAASVFTQAVGQPIPAEVRRVLGKHTPALPPGAAFIWGQDAGTGMVYPTLWTAADHGADLARIVGKDAALRAAQWERQREEARLAVRTRRHAVLRDIIPAAQRAKLRHYVRQLRERGYFPELNDGQVALRASIHNQPTIAALHNGLAGIVSSINVEPVIPSYCFLSCYEEHAVLDRHLDRAQCVYNLCVVLDMQYLDREGDPEPWPIYLELDGKPEPALMRVGDGVFFSGNSIWHWRDALPAGQRAVVCFNHFVPHGFRGSLD